MAWEEVKLGEICEFKYGKNLPEKKRIVGKYPVYGSSSVVGTHNEYLVEGPAIIIGRKGTVGKIQFSKTNFFPIDTTFYLEYKKEKVILEFLYYRISFCGLENMNSDAAVPGLNRQLALKQKIKLPPLEIQQKIVNLISNYDDLIENNNKRIKLLEQSAEELYKEWFVRLRFPNYQNTKIEDGIPQGWEEVILKDECTIIMGQSPKSHHYNENEEGLPFHQGVSNYGFRFPKNEIWSTDGKRISKKGDILFSVRAPVGRLNISNENIILGRGLSSIRHKKNLNSFLFYYLKNIFYKDNIIGSGAIFESVTKNDIENIKILKSNSIIEQFNSVVNEIDFQIDKLIQKNQILKQTRDLLLPRLISGKLDIEKLDIN